MTDEKNYVEVYCPRCGNITVLTLMELPLLAQGSFIPLFECLHCEAMFRIEVHFHQESDD